MVAITHKATSERRATQEGQSRRRWLSDSFNRGAQTLDEATESARAMADSLERRGVLMRAPVRR